MTICVHDQAGYVDDLFDDDGMRTAGASAADLDYANMWQKKLKTSGKAHGEKRLPLTAHVVSMPMLLTFSSCVHWHGGVSIHSSGHPLSDYDQSGKGRFRMHTNGDGYALCPISPPLHTQVSNRCSAGL